MKFIAAERVMPPIADTPPPPYYAVIFTSLRTNIEDGYDAMAQKMLDLAARQPGSPDIWAPSLREKNWA